MEIPVFVEQVAGNGYVAKSGEPLALRVEGDTEAEALTKMERELTSRLQNGRLTQLTVPPNVHPWMGSAGIFAPDDPVVQEWMEIMTENRRKSKIDANTP
jgi:hypothetical protein